MIFKTVKQAKLIPNVCELGGGLFFFGVRKRRDSSLAELELQLMQCSPEGEPSDSF